MKIFSSPTSLFLTSLNPSIYSNSCLANFYLGTYGTQSTSVFVPNRSCFDESPRIAFDSKRDEVELVWLEDVPLAESLAGQKRAFEDELTDFLNLIGSSHSEGVENQEQHTFPNAGTTLQLIHSSNSSALLSISSPLLKALDNTIPRFWKLIVLPTGPIPLTPVPDHAIQRLTSLLESLSFNPKIDSIVSDISLPQMKKDITFLTGEDPESPIRSRHSFTDGAIAASAWIYERFEETGATCEARFFLEGFAPNIICRYPSTQNHNTDTAPTVLLGAHYDSRGSFGSARAPGADDDASGTTSLLAIARTIARRGVTFRSNVELVAFAGEEQGLLGSRAYAQQLRNSNANLTLMIQADMLAYHLPEEPQQLGLQKLIGTPEVAQLVGNVSELYTNLTVGYSSACCSDHQSFHQQGFPATEVSERGGPIADPMYHSSGDLSDREGFDLEQVRAIAQVTFATLLHTAGFDLEEVDNV